MDFIFVMHADSQKKHFTLGDQVKRMKSPLRAAPSRGVVGGYYEIRARWREIQAPRCLFRRVRVAATPGGCLRSSAHGRVARLVASHCVSGTLRALELLLVLPVSTPFVVVCAPLPPLARVVWRPYGRLSPRGERWGRRWPRQPVCFGPWRVWRDGCIFLSPDRTFLWGVCAISGGEAVLTVILSSYSYSSRYSIVQ